MAPIIPDPRKIKRFRTEAAFATWLRANHPRETEVWLKIHKKDSGLPTVTCAQALDVALCWGWIDGIRKALDERSYLQRCTPRRAKSVWSQINRDHVARLTAAGRMTRHGQRQVDAAKADGRWAAAYAPIRKATEATIPDDLRASIEANPRARKTFRTLGRQNLFALAFRTNNMKTPAGRAKKIAALVAMLARGQTIVPELRRVGSTLRPAINREEQGDERNAGRGSVHENRSGSVDVGLAGKRARLASVRSSGCPGCLSRGISQLGAREERAGQPRPPEFREHRRLGIPAIRQGQQERTRIHADSAAVLRLP
jgi:uncharacterized protein YdeI (YjbR/CyaY-like superfamily)